MLTVRALAIPAPDRPRLTGIRGGGGAADEHHGPLGWGRHSGRPIGRGRGTRQEYVSPLAGHRGRVFCSRETEARAPPRDRAHRISSDDFLLGKIHKEIVQALVAAAEDPANGETQLLKVRWPGARHNRGRRRCADVRPAPRRQGKVAGAAHQGLIQKNKQVLATLETLVDPQTNEVTAESIKAKELPNAVARFYYNLALAEGRASR